MQDALVVGAIDHHTMVHLISDLDSARMACEQVLNAENEAICTYWQFHLEGVLPPYLSMHEG
ncbi:MAG: hypothetical protein U0Q18_14815 [Bryobacteraceae bacterium]